MLYAAKAVAGTVMRLFDSSELLSEARKEHKERIGSGYVCGIPNGVAPYIPKKER